ncbi:MAG: hypothetical protein AAF517_27355, partial [Planctomycetota bacterium]
MERDRGEVSRGGLSDGKSDQEMKHRSWVLEKLNRRLVGAASESRRVIYSTLGLEPRAAKAPPPECLAKR